MNLIRNKFDLTSEFYTSNFFSGTLLSYNILEPSGYLNFERSVAVFNTFSGIKDVYAFCHSGNIDFYVELIANKFDDPEIVTCLGEKRYNSTLDFPDIEVIANFPIKRFTQSYVGEKVRFQFMALDKYAFRFERELKVEAKYKIDGAIYKVNNTWEGFSPEIAIDEKESYDIVPSIVESSKPYVLSFDRIILEVY